MPNVTKKSVKVNIMGFFSLQFSSYRENLQVIQKVKISLILEISSQRKVPKSWVADRHPAGRPRLALHNVRANE
jgi:hypothetical protein